MQGQFLFAGSLFSPLQFFQNHLVHLVDIAAAQCDDQIASLCQSNLEAVRAAARETTLSFGKVQHPTFR